MLHTIKLRTDQIETLRHVLQSAQDVYLNAFEYSAGSDPDHANAMRLMEQDTIELKGWVEFCCSFWSILNQFPATGKGITTLSC